MKKPIVSIAGCGWLGMPLALHLLNKGYEVNGSTTREEKLPILEAQGIKPFLLHLSENSFPLFSSFFNVEQMIVMVPPRSRSSERGTYLASMQRLVVAFDQFPNLKQVVFTSSTSVYPDQAGWAKEEHVLRAEESGHPELFVVEQLFLRRPEVIGTVLRLGGLTGGSRLLARHFAGKKELKGGNHPVNLVHWRDAVEAVTMAIEQQWQGIYNVCSPVHPLKKDFYRQLCLQSGLPLPEFLVDDQGGKTIDTQKLIAKGYRFIYDNPYDYRYNDLD